LLSTFASPLSEYCPHPWALPYTKRISSLPKLGFCSTLTFAFICDNALTLKPYPTSSTPLPLCNKRKGLKWDSSLGRNKKDKVSIIRTNKFQCTRKLLGRLLACGSDARSSKIYQALGCFCPTKS
jgi:hypothetical protein